MKRIAMRSWTIWLMVAVLLGGLGLFVAEFVMDGENWVMHSGSPHVYENGNSGLSKGLVFDREGNLVLNYSQNRIYAESAAVRKAMLHFLGDRQGNIYAPIILNYTQQMAGFDLVGGMYDYGSTGGKATLTLSAQLQAVALEAMGDKTGTVAVYNYKTGQILCAVTTPTFDPDAVPDIAGDTTGAYSGVYVNRFIQSAYVPGSVFKIITTAAALEQIPDIQDQTFTCQGEVLFGNDRVTCAYTHGTVDLKKAMMVSCNCAYAQIAMQLGPQTLQACIDRYGALNTLSFDGLTTAKGNVALEGQAQVQVAWSAIGQHKDQINPCAFLSFVGTIANGGQGVQPYLVESIQSGGKLTYEAKVTPMERIMSSQTAQILQNYMRNNVVQNYGADNFPGLTVCAKSGTGEVGGDKKPNALMAGFVADEAYPYAFVAVVEDGGYGQSVCVPILAKILEACKALS